MRQQTDCFPSDSSRRKKWNAAIRRDVGKFFQVISRTRVCLAHFKNNDFVLSSSYQTESVLRRLFCTAVPSVFDWSVSVTSRRCFERKQVSKTSPVSAGDPQLPPFDAEVDDGVVPHPARTNVIL